MQFYEHFVFVLTRFEELESMMDTLEKSESSNVVDENINNHSCQEALKEILQYLELELTLHKKAFEGLDREAPTKNKNVYAPKLKFYDSTQDAQNIENFIQNMEWYFASIQALTRIRRKYKQLLCI